MLALNSARNGRFFEFIHPNPSFVCNTPKTSLMEEVSEDTGVIGPEIARKSDLEGFFYYRKPFKIKLLSQSGSGAEP